MIFAEAGFALRGVTDLAPHLVPGAGVLAGQITPQDETDATRAAAITADLEAGDCPEEEIRARVARARARLRASSYTAALGSSAPLATGMAMMFSATMRARLSTWPSV